MKPAWNTENAKLNATELAKLEKDGLDVVRDIETFAKQGAAGLTAADYDRLKWLGVYAHKPKGEGFFLLRVKFPGGTLTAAQAEVIAGIAGEYGRSVLDITTRQCIEFHWLTLAVLPAVLTKLAQAGLTTLEAAGDCPRNILGNPLAGIDPDEFIDTTPIVDELNSFFHNNREFSNLPRKFKIAITGGIDNSINAEINDVAFVPAVKEHRGELLKGFQVLVGGGLSHQPRLATRLQVFVRPEEVVTVAGAVAAIFRDHGYREKRNHTRLKYLMADWGKEKFTAELLRLTGPLLAGGAVLNGSWNTARFHGLHQQKQKGLFYWGIVIPGGRLTPDELAAIAGLARIYGDGTLRTTNLQDIIIPNIAAGAVDRIQQEKLYQTQEQLRASAISRIVSCPGKAFCPFGITETKGRVNGLAAAIDNAIGTEAPVRIHINGCGNSCGQAQIADIGLQGTVIPAEGQPREAFEIWVGGRLGSGGKLAVKLPGRIPAGDINETVAAMVKDYAAHRNPAETFAEYVDRKGSLKPGIALDELKKTGTN